MTNDAGRARHESRSGRISEADVQAALAATNLCNPANRGLLRGGGFSSQFVEQGAGCPSRWRASTSWRAPARSSRSPRAGTVELPARGPQGPRRADGPDLADPLFVPRTRMAVGPVPRRLLRDGELGGEPRCDQLCHIGADLISLAVHPAHPGPHAPTCPSSTSAALRVGEPRHGRSRGRGLPRLRELRPALRAALTGVTPSHPLLASNAPPHRGRVRPIRGNVGLTGRPGAEPVPQARAVPGVNATVSPVSPDS